MRLRMCRYFLLSAALGVSPHSVEDTELQTNSKAKRLLICRGVALCCLSVSVSVHSQRSACMYVHMCKNIYTVALQCSLQFIQVLTSIFSSLIFSTLFQSVVCILCLLLLLLLRLTFLGHDSCHVFTHTEVCSPQIMAVLNN